MFEHIQMCGIWDSIWDPNLWQIIFKRNILQKRSRSGAGDQESAASQSPAQPQKTEGMNTLQVVSYPIHHGHRGFNMVLHGLVTGWVELGSQKNTLGEPEKPVGNRQPVEGRCPAFLDGFL